MDRFLRTTIILLFIVHCSLFTAFSQQKYYDFGFERDLTPQVTTDNGHILKFPWAGGMNECQFSAIDLNFDGIKDLFVFDKSGNRILTFLNNGTAGQPDYIYAPEYEQYFPALHDWATLIDYNKDGKITVGEAKRRMREAIPGAFVSQVIGEIEKKSGNWE